MTSADVCLCLCQANHARTRGICTAEATTKVRFEATGRTFPFREGEEIIVPMCQACAEATLEQPRAA